MNFRRTIARTLLLAAALGAALPPSLAFGCHCHQPAVPTAETATNRAPCCQAHLAYAEHRPTKSLCCTAQTAAVKTAVSSCCQQKLSNGGACCQGPGGCDCADCGCQDTPAPTAPPNQTTTPDIESISVATVYAPASLSAEAYPAAHRLITDWRNTLWQTSPPGVSELFCVWTL